MKKNPLVSIVVPTYNVDKYIISFINSIISQTYQNWELILVDDGSSDKTLEYIKIYSGKDTRVHLLIRNNEPKGANTCRNIGQIAARGEYLILFDSDDIVEKWCLEQRVSYMENNLDIDYASFKGQTAIFDAFGDHKKINQYWGINSSKGDILLCFLSAKYCFGVWNNIYRMDIFTNYFWDEQLKIYMDFDYIVRALLNNYKHSFSEESEIDYLYIIGRPNALTSNFISEEKFDSTMYLLNKIMKMLELQPKHKLYKRTFKKFFIMQYQRIVMNGSVQQIKTFYEFIINQYNYSLNFRVKLIFFCLRIVKIKELKQLKRKLY